MEKLKIVGFYKESPIINNSDNEKSRYIVVYENSRVDDSLKWLEGFNVLEGHFELKDVRYLDTCEKITKEQYLEATKGWYTPSEYL